LEAPVEPFAGVTIGDTNSGATDALSITLAGSGTLADGVGFQGLTGSNGSYTLSGHGGGDHGRTRCPGVHAG
jgi:hypothetical protein